MTRVKFYRQPDGQILAYFPDEPYYSPETNNDHRTRTCYAHVGQHSACRPDYLKKCRLAAPEEFVDLLAELKGQGYDDLEVIDARKPLTKILSNVSGAPLWAGQTWANRRQIKRYTIPMCPLKMAAMTPEGLTGDHRQT